MGVYFPCKKVIPILEVIMRITEKGQVTIPKEIRENYGLQPGQEVQFVDEGRRVFLEKAGSKDVWRRYRGFLKQKGKKTDEWIAKLRGVRP